MALANAQVALSVQTHEDSAPYHRLDARTDGTGLARIPLKFAGRVSNIVAWVGDGTRMTFARGQSGESGQNGKEVLAYLLTDRPLYKPGETVGVKLFLRSRKDGPSAPVSDATVRVRIYDPQSREVKVETLRTNPFGTANFSLKLGADAQLGAWRFYLESQEISLSLEPTGRLPGRRIQTA